MAIVKVVPAALACEIDIYIRCQGLGDFSVLAVVPKPLVSVHMSVTIHSAIEKHLVFIVTKKNLENICIFLEFSCYYQKPI